MNARFFWLVMFVLMLFAIVTSAVAGPLAASFAVPASTVLGFMYGRRHRIEVAPKDLD